MRTKLNNVWKCMRERCNNPNNISYKIYGARGICVCEEWSEYSAFKRWAIDTGYKDGLTLDRIDVDGNYEPDNCRWATRKEQARNRRNNRIVEYKGEKLTLAECAELKGVSPSTLRNRLNYGWSIEEAMETDVRPDGIKLLTHNGQTHTIPQWVKLTGISKAAIYGRLKLGWDTDRILTTPNRIVHR